MWSSAESQWITKVHFYLLIILLGFNSSGERGGRVLVLHMTNLSDLDLKGTQEERHQDTKMKINWTYIQVTPADAPSAHSEAEVTAPPAY